MAKARVGAKVMFCNHDGWFIADVHRIGNVNLVKAAQPVKAENIVRGRNSEATHHLSDGRGGYWKPLQGIFVVPASAVREL